MRIIYVLLIRYLVAFILTALVMAACSPGQGTPAPTVESLITQTVNANQAPEETPSSSMPQTPSGTLTTSQNAQTPDQGIAPAALPMLSIGSESNDLMLQEDFPLIQEAGIDTFRYNGLIWSRVEKIEGERDWAGIVDFEENLSQATSLGVQTILVVRGTPEWAQKVPGFYCGPIKPEKLQAFADFLGEAVSRYSQPPYNVEYWELWNEPDVDARLVKFQSVFGCWGDAFDPYYGGEFFAEMLKAAYPAIKAADPEAQVLLGGLLLDCDPTNPPEGEECIPGKFFEGILKNGGGDYFDLLSFHGYANYSGPSSGNDPLYLDLHHPKWENRGGVVLGKIDLLREVMASYGIEKPLIHTEGSLICPGANKIDCDPPTQEFFEAQADYVVWLFVRDWAAGLHGAVWYPFEGPGWRYGALLDENQNPKPAHRALSFLTKELQGAAYVQPVDQIAPLTGYEFNSGDKRIWVVWSTDGASYPFTITEEVQAIFDKYGNPVDVSSGQVNVTSPMYVEFNP